MLTRIWPLPDDLPHAAGMGDLGRGIDTTIADHRWGAAAKGWALHAVKNEEMARWLAARGSAAEGSATPENPGRSPK
jgi:hypothetical protein